MPPRTPWWRVAVAFSRRAQCPNCATNPPTTCAAHSRSSSSWMCRDCRWTKPATIVRMVNRCCCWERMMSRNHWVAVSALWSQRWMPLLRVPKWLAAPTDWCHQCPKSTHFDLPCAWWCDSDRIECGQYRVRHGYWGVRTMIPNRAEHVERPIFLEPIDRRSNRPKHLNDSRVHVSLEDAVSGENKQKLVLFAGRLHSIRPWDCHCVTAGIFSSYLFDFGDGDAHLLHFAVAATLQCLVAHGRHWVRLQCVLLFP